MNKNTTWMVTGVLGVAGVVAAAVLTSGPSGATPAPGEAIVVSTDQQVKEPGNDGGARPVADRTSGAESGNGSGNGSGEGSGNSGSGNGGSGNGGSGDGGSGNGGSGNGGSSGGNSDDDAPETVSLASPVSAQSPQSAASPED